LRIFSKHAQFANGLMERHNGIQAFLSHIVQLQH
jgi:hypothetical protein